MKTQNSVVNDRKMGASLVTTVVMLAVAGVTVGAVVQVSTQYGRQARRHEGLNKAMYLADAGLRAGLVKLKAESDGGINLQDSHRYFADTTPFDGAYWGFQTEITVVNGSNVLVSTGVYDQQRQDMEMAVVRGAGDLNIHAMYAHAMYAGNSSGTNYTLEIGGTGSGADFVNGDVYAAGNIDVSGDAVLRLPEIINEVVYDDICDLTTETWQDAFAAQFFSNALPQAAYNSYVSSVSAYNGKFYNNGQYDFGEPYVDSIGNGVYDVGEPFNDANGNGVRDSGDGYVDANGNGVYDEGVDSIIDNGNGVYDEGEEWTEDWHHPERQNGRYDPAGGYWLYTSGHGWHSSGSWSWETTYTSGWGWRTRTHSCSDWPAETFEDVGNDNFNPGESYVDQNGLYDVGEEYLDDRNGRYDYGTQAYGTITGMPSPGPGQRSSTGHDSLISPPDLMHMYYNVSKDDLEPFNALSRWGHDVEVAASDYGSSVAITDSTHPEHIFIRNPPTSGSTTSGGKRINGRSYDRVYDNEGNRIDDYFFEDPTDSTYNSSDSSASIDGTSYTSPMYVNVLDSGNEKLYYIEGNMYIHSPTAYCMRFRKPGTRITIVARGNITISDEFYYNADYDPHLSRSDVNSTIVNNPSDALCLIALKNPDCVNSGNIYIGDAQFGTGGSIHAMLYAENNFVDNNLNTSSQAFISIFGNMTAGNQIDLHRSGNNRTRLDITLDQRIRDGNVIVPGLPHPVGVQRGIQRGDSAWAAVPGTWKCWSPLQ